MNLTYWNPVTWTPSPFSQAAPTPSLALPVTITTELSSQHSAGDMLLFLQTPISLMCEATAPRLDGTRQFIKFNFFELCPQDKEYVKTCRLKCPVQKDRKYEMKLFSLKISPPLRDTKMDAVNAAGNRWASLCESVSICNPSLSAFHHAPQLFFVSTRHISL